MGPLDDGTRGGGQVLEYERPLRRRRHTPVSFLVLLGGSLMGPLVVGPFLLCRCMDTGSDDLNLAAMMGAIVFGICVLLGIPWLAFREARRIRNSRVAVFRGKKLIELGVMMYLVWCLAACGVVLIPLMFIAPRRTMLALVDLFRGKQLGSIIDKWRI